MTSVIRVFLASGTLSFFSFYLQAQTTHSDSLSSDVTLREVVVQATRAQQNSPVPHTNYSAAQLSKQYHAQDIPFLLTGVPSLVETSDAGAGTGYTGLRIRGSDPTRVNITLNGIPVNDAESQGVFWVNMPDLVSSVDEIQVQRGVGTSTNGAGAFGATINLDLSKVESQRFASINNTLGSFGTRRHSVHLGTGLLDNGLAFSARVSQVYSDGYVDRASANLRGIHLTGAYVDEKQSLQFHLLSGHEITYQAWNGLPVQYLNDPNLRTYNVSGTERNGSPHPDEVDNYTQRHYLLHYKRQLATNWMLQLNGHYTRGFGYFEQYKADQELANYGIRIGDSSTTSTDLIRRRWLDNHFYGGTFALRWLPEWSWKSSVLWGGGLSRYEGDHFGELIWAAQYTGVLNDYRYYDNQAAKTDGNLFMKVETAPAEPWNLFADLQIRSVNYQFEGYNNELNQVDQTAALLFFNPKIGASYRFAPQWQSYVFAGIGHREPNRDDYTQSTPNSRPKPEQMLDLEGGLRFTRGIWTGSVNIFHMQYRNQLVLDGRINDVGAYIRTNVPDSRRTGVELEFNGALGKSWQLGGSASLSQNKVREFTEFIDVWDTGEQLSVQHRNTDLAFSPALIARAEVGKTWWNKVNGVGKGHTFASTLIGKYVSRQYLDNTSNRTASLDPYGVCDLRLNWTLSGYAGKQLNLIFSLNNFLNAQFVSNGWVYRFVSAGYDPRPDDPYAQLESGSTYQLSGLFPQAGRHWMATVQWLF
ncbi:MAG TPA: TonB-dependent receptor [Saprospiraceae bacterium]|nr:TonB-dependent receptor [Saprospiraceae bacterium]